MNERDWYVIRIDGYIKLGDIMVLLIRNSCFFWPTPCGVAHSTSPSFWLVGLAGSNPSDGQKMVFIYRIRYCAKQVVAPSFISQSEEIPYCRESDSALKLCVKSKKKKFFSVLFLCFDEDCTLEGELQWLYKIWTNWFWKSLSNTLNPNKVNTSNLLGTWWF